MNIVFVVLLWVAGRSCCVDECSLSSIREFDGDRLFVVCRVFVCVGRCVCV